MHILYYNSSCFRIIMQVVHASCLFHVTNHGDEMINDQFILGVKYNIQCMSKTIGRALLTTIWYITATFRENLSVCMSIGKCLHDYLKPLEQYSQKIHTTTTTHAFNLPLVPHNLPRGMHNLIRMVLQQPKSCCHHQYWNPWSC